MKLPRTDDVERKAREAGLSSGEKIGEMVQAEARRQRQTEWERLQAKLALVRADFLKANELLSEDEIQAMIDQWIDEAASNSLKRGS